MCALDLSSASVHTLQDISEVSASVSTLSYPSPAVITRHRIESWQASESAWIFFTRESSTSKPLVMKVLRPYKDMRYNLSSIVERQRCQLEAIQQNRNFTPEVYIGLARLHNRPSEEEHILISDIIQLPTQPALEPGAEYALIMERLPDNLRFDQLLKADDQTVQEYLDTLASHIAYLHRQRTPSLPLEEGAYWGSYSLLQSKLEENLTLLALALDRSNSLSSEATINRFKTMLHEVFTKERYARYLEQRVQVGNIKHCHGDIKSLNIWIIPGSTGEHQQYSSVKLLDAIDFNPLFCNIDILSDFAMLVIDVQARTQSAEYARRMIENYLLLTHQEDTPSRVILEFYLFEKAIVTGAINILFDNQLELGHYLLHLAQEHLDALLDCWLYQPA